LLSPAFGGREPFPPRLPFPVSPRGLVQAISSRLLTRGWGQSFCSYWWGCLAGFGVTARLGSWMKKGISCIFVCLLPGHSAAVDLRSSDIVREPSSCAGWVSGRTLISTTTARDRPFSLFVDQASLANLSDLTDFGFAPTGFATGTSLDRDRRSFSNALRQTSTAGVGKGKSSVQVRSRSETPAWSARSERRPWLQRGVVTEEARQTAAWPVAG